MLVSHMRLCVMFKEAASHARTTEQHAGRFRKNVKLQIIVIAVVYSRETL